MAASPGLEPRLTESESAVLPLDDEAITLTLHNIYAFLLLLSNGLLHTFAKKSLLPNTFFRALIIKEKEHFFLKNKRIFIMKKRSKHISKKGTQADSAEPPKRNFCFNFSFNEDCVALKEV